MNNPTNPLPAVSKATVGIVAGDTRVAHVLAGNDT